jgi:pilus assembly protein CpaC
MTRIAMILLLGLAAFPAESEDVVELLAGEIKILEVGEVERVAVGNASLMSTSLLENGQLLVIAEKAGITTLHIWYTDGRESDRMVHIDEAKIEDIKRIAGLEGRAEEVRMLLSAVDGLDVRIVGERIVLSGDIDPSHQPSIDTVKEVYTELMDLTRKDRLLLPSEKMVLMHIQITEFKKNTIESLGILWQNAVVGPTAAGAWEINSQGSSILDSGETVPPALAMSTFADAGSGGFGFFGIASEITSRIDFAVDSGDALILAEPRLIARSGGKADFLAGGEIPIKVVTQTTTDVEFKPFGITLEIEPTVDDDDNILALVNTELSTADFANQVDGVPSFLTRRTSADVRMHSGETLVISGLVNYTASKAITKIWGLGDIPVLGALFRSKGFRDENTELVIFVTPTVTDASSESNRAAVERQKAIVDKFQEVVEESELDIMD